MLEAIPLPTHETDHICADCGDAIVYMEEVFLLQIVRPQLLDGRTLYWQVTDEEEPDGPFKFEPYYFCFACWEKLYESVRSDMQDEPPVEDEASQFECVCCSSGIRGTQLILGQVVPGELAGTFTLGEFHVSSRAPDGVRGPNFMQLSSSNMLCLYCTGLMSDGYIDMWADLSENGECSDCVQARCHRTSNCNCRCHYDPPENDEDATPTDWRV
jgi:hypothetical protein